MPSRNTPKSSAPSRRRKAEAGPTLAAKRAQIVGEDAAEVDPYAPSVWGSADAAGALQDLTLPSGQRCLAQKPGPEGLMMAGLLDDLDTLAPALQKITGNRPGSKTPNLAHVIKNSGMMAKTIDLMNRVAVHVVIKPELTPEPENPADKVIGQIYPSSISLEDKMFLFNWASGGSSDLAAFRRQLEESVASVDTGEDVELSSE